MRVDPNDPRPAYLQVADDLRAKIQDGRLAPGTRLASLRDLATEYNIAPMTAQNALRLLRDEGLVATHPGRGTFVGAEDTAAAAADDPVLADLEAIQAELQDLRQRVVDQDEAASSRLREITTRLDALERAIANEPLSGR